MCWPGLPKLFVRREPRGVSHSVRVTQMNKKISSLLVAAVIMFGTVVYAQQPAKTYRIGFLSGGFPGPTHWTTRLRAELQKGGYVEGKNIVIEARYTENKIERLAAFADELV